MDCSLPGSSVYGIFQARVLEWGAIAFSASRGEAKDSALLSSRDAGLLEPPLRPHLGKKGQSLLLHQGLEGSGLAADREDLWGPSSGLALRLLRPPQSWKGRQDGRGAKVMEVRRWAQGSHVLSPGLLVCVSPPRL